MKTSDLSKLPRLLMLVVGLLLAVEVVVGFGRWLGVIGADGTLIQLFDLRLEGNIPTWFSSMVLAANAAVVAAIASRSVRRRIWWSISGIFLGLSIDEVAQIHERLPSAILLVGAVVFGGALAMASTSLEPSLRRSLWIAAALYLAGGGGVDAISPLLFDGAGPVSGLLILVEEGLEMIGAVLLLAVWIRTLTRDRSTPTVADGVLVR